MELFKNYRDDKALRDSFNELAGRVFDLNFEQWYQNGFWQDNYNPHSVVIDGKVVANVSVNKCNMLYNGEPLRLLQIGTVMTDPDYRGRGYARFLLEEVIKEYETKVDGIYLYANDSVLEFYAKFGFEKRNEYGYSKSVNNTLDSIVEAIRMDTKNDWDKMVEVMKSRSQAGNMIMFDNEGLFMFYLSQFMTETVFYIRGYDTYVVAEIEGSTLLLYAIWGEASTDEVIAAFGRDIDTVRLLFTPVDKTGYEEHLVEEEDTTFFVKGKAFELLADYRYMLQPITHA